MEKSKEFIIKALKASFNKTWIDKELLNLRISEEPIYSTGIEIQLENIISKLMDYGGRDKRFEKDWQKVLNGLKEKKAEIFEPSLQGLGEFLDMNSHRPTGKGTPDGVWYFMKYWAVFEAKTNIEDSSKEIPLDDIRQAGYHESWIKTNMNVPEDADIRSCIICEKHFVEEYAKHAVDNLNLIAPDELITKATTFGDILRTTIQKLKFLTESEAKEYLAKSLIEEELTVQKLIE